MPPPAERRKRPQDGISRVQKVAMEIGFRGAFGCLMAFNMLFYIIFGTNLLTGGPVIVFFPILVFR